MPGSAPGRGRRRSSPGGGGAGKLSGADSPVPRGPDRRTTPEPFTNLNIEEVRMVAPSQADGVRALAEPLAHEAGLVVESVTVTPAGKRRVLRVIVDLPENRTGGVPMDAVSEAARLISEALDQSPVMGGT